MDPKRPRSAFSKAATKSWEFFLCPFPVMNHRGNDAAAHCKGAKVLSGMLHPEMLYHFALGVGATAIFTAKYGPLPPAVQAYMLVMMANTLALTSLMRQGTEYMSALRTGQKYYISKKHEPAPLSAAMVGDLQYRRRMGKLFFGLTCLVTAIDIASSKTALSALGAVNTSIPFLLMSMSRIKRTEKALNLEWAVLKENPDKLPKKKPKERVVKTRFKPAHALTVR